MAEEIPATGPTSPRRPGRLGRLAPFAFGVLVTIAAVSLYGALNPGPPPLTQREVDDSVAEALASVTPAPALSSLVFDAVQPSLVLIQTQKPDEEGDPGSGDGLGSGVVVNLDGDILTSLHVVANATHIDITFADGTKSAGGVIATQPEDDIAVVRADHTPSTLVPAILGNPAAATQGTEAFVMGNPFGLSWSISGGVISGLDRTFRLEKTGRVLEGLIQIDAAVNPGNSGGPLLNREGHVIGIVTALVNPTDDDVFIGIGLAVPINVAGGAAGLPPY